MLRRAALFSLCLGTFFTSAPSLASIVPIDRIVAVVNEGIITESQLNSEFSEVKTHLSRSQGQLPSDQDLKKQVLDKLVLDEVQVQLGERTGIIIDDQTLDTMISDVAERNNLTLTQLRETLEKDNIDFKQFREMLKRQNIINQLQQRDVVREVNVSKAELDQFLNSAQGQSMQGYEYQLSHILVALPEAPTPEDIQKAQLEADAILTKLQAGADFNQTALSKSNSSSALSGGDLGWKALPELPTIFADDAARLKVGEIAGPIRSASGFHLVKLKDKRLSEKQESSIDKTLVRHILIKPNALLTDSEAQMRLENLKHEIASGTDFSVLAKTHSEDLASSNQGGSLSWVTAEQLVPEFTEVMESAKIGEVSAPFKSPFGWHILEVLERKTESNLEEIIKLNAQNMIRSRKVDEKLENWMRQMRDEAFVEIHLDGYKHDQS